MGDSVRRWIDTIIRYVPGFRGYEQADDREASLTELRTWIVQRLAPGKRGIDGVTRTLAEQGQLDALASWDRLRHGMDHQLARVRAMSQDYRGFSGQGNLSPDQLEDLYDCDANLMDHVETFATELEKRLSTPADAESLLLGLDRLSRYLDQRENYLKGHENR